MNNIDMGLFESFGIKKEYRAMNNNFLALDKAAKDQRPVDIVIRKKDGAMERMEYCIVDRLGEKEVVLSRLDSSGKLDEKKIIVLLADIESVTEDDVYPKEDRFN